VLLVSEDGTKQFADTCFVKELEIKAKTNKAIEIITFRPPSGVIEFAEGLALNTDITFKSLGMEGYIFAVVAFVDPMGKVYHAYSEGVYVRPYEKKTLTIACSLSLWALSSFSYMLLASLLYPTSVLSLSRHHSNGVFFSPLGTISPQLFSLNFHYNYFLNFSRPTTNFLVFRGELSQKKSL